MNKPVARLGRPNNRQNNKMVKININNKGNQQGMRKSTRPIIKRNRGQQNQAGNRMVLY